MESGLINGTLETKFKAAPFNITEKWTTDNKLTTEISMDNQFIEGTKVQLNTNFAPSSGFVPEQLSLLASVRSVRKRGSGKKSKLSKNYHNPSSWSVTVYHKDLLHRKKSAAVKAFYACDKVNMTMDSDITLSGPTIQGSIVTG